MIKRIQLIETICRKVGIRRNRPCVDFTKRELALLNAHLDLLQQRLEDYETAEQGVVGGTQR